MKIVAYPQIDANRLALLAEAAERAVVANAVDEDAAFMAMHDADAFFGKISPRLLAGAARLRWIQAPTAGLEHYMFPELVAHPAVLTNMRGIHADPIADQVLGYILSFARNLHLYVRRQVTARWEPVGGELTRPSVSEGQGNLSGLDVSTIALSEATLGIVGLGSIGRAVALRGAAFGMRIVAVDPQTLSVPAGVNAVWDSRELDHLLGLADFVVIAAPQTPDTVRLFDRARLRQMKSSAYLINVGRGAIVVLDDLVEALQDRSLAGAALDVFEIEPLPPSHALWRMENVIITPHVAGYAPTVAKHHLEVLLDNARRFARGQPLINVVDKARWY